MKNTVYIVLTALAGLLSACSTVSYLDIETYNPGEITFPKNVESVVIVNNAVPQPSKLLYKYSLFGKVQDTAKVVADSALFDACKALGETIAQEPFFKDVRLYNDRTREGDDYFADTKLTPAQINSICEETNCDAIISIDRLLFNMNKDVVAMGDGSFNGTIAVQSSAVIRAYLPGRNNPLTTIFMDDSLFWVEDAPHPVWLNYNLTQPDEALRKTAAYIGSKAYTNFVPHWENTGRWYYTNSGARWKEASAFAAKEKWAEAIKCWTSIFNYEKRAINKAKAASNLALGYEIQGNLDESFNWAKQSLALFSEKNSDEKDNNVKLLTLYVEQLSKRIIDDKKLNIQFGEE